LLDRGWGGKSKKWDTPYDRILKKKKDKTNILMHNKNKKFERLQASLKRQQVVH
jgi:hypothetical protein